jgi:hypothetical protein
MDDEDYVSPALAAAMAMHEMFTTFVKAGFTEAQALTMVVELLKNQL